MLTSLYTVYISLHAMMTETSSYNRDQMYPENPKILTVFPFQKKICQLLIYTTFIYFSQSRNSTVSQFWFKPFSDIVSPKN